MKTYIRKMSILATIILVCIGGFFIWAWQSKKYSGPVEKIRIAGAVGIVPALVDVARDQGYFKEFGLDAEVTLGKNGVTNMQDLLAGTFDVIATADFVFVKQSLATSDIRILGSIDAVSNVIKIVARKDHAIDTPGDLKGKKVGVIVDSSAEFFLSEFLTFNNLKLTDINKVSVQQSDMENLLAAGTVDAVVIWRPVVDKIVKRLGANAVVFDAQGSQQYYFTLVSQSELLKTRPAVIERLWKALLLAEEFIKNNPAAAQKIIYNKGGNDSTVISDLWPTNSFAISLDQSLVLLMEDEARWAIEKKLTVATTIPNYLNFIYFDALEKIKPEAITITH